MDRWKIDNPQQGLVKLEWISDKIDQTTVDFAKIFGTYLAKDDTEEKLDKEGKKLLDKYGKPVKINVGDKLTTSQLRKFFGEVKRQQTIGYNESSFVMLCPKLAYAVGRAKKSMKNGVKYCKIEDFYTIMEDAIKKVDNSSDKKKAFKNFISIFEAIVAYHKAEVKE